LRAGSSGQNPYSRDKNRFETPVRKIEATPLRASRFEDDDEDENDAVVSNLNPLRGCNSQQAQYSNPPPPQTPLIEDEDDDEHEDDFDAPGEGGSD
jgi:hypothetical protein